MIRTNLFPAILLAGPPHSGKSVLSYMLTQRLRDQRMAHYLLRAVPDGEGDWFMEGDPGLVRELRLNNKSEYSSSFVAHMQRVIQSRAVPLLVDVGGCPRGDQFNILSACTHSILLYRTDEEYSRWRHILDPMDLLPVAELRSTQVEPERITQKTPVLQGVISGLEREKDRRKKGNVFSALTEYIAGIFHYDEAFLEHLHSQQSPMPLISERNLAQQLQIEPEGGKIIWKPEDLERLQKLLPIGKECALYGRGPVWLAAFLAAYTSPAAMAIFDVRYGWVNVPEVEFGTQTNLKAEISQWGPQGECLSITTSQALEPDTLVIPPVNEGGGLAISGKLPRWAFAALARHIAPLRSWIGIDDSRCSRVIIIHSNTPSVAIGDVIPKS